ncbi:MAG: glycosyltransferase, partial [Chitinophagaceae bacterium]
IIQYIFIEKNNILKKLNTFIQEEFYRRYQVQYSIVRNLPVTNNTPSSEKFTEPTIIYQGAVNEGRSFETLIPAMKWVDARLLICGNGNYLKQAKKIVAKEKLENKIAFLGSIHPDELKLLTTKAHIGVTLFEKTGLNQYYSLANRFFDYLMAGIPQVCVDYPEYRQINQEYHFALLIDNTSEKSIAEGLNKLLTNAVLYNTLQNNAIKAREKLNWTEEEKVLLAFWKNILS